MASEPASAPLPHPQLQPQADAATVQQAALQLSHALTTANLDHEFERLQPLIIDARAQLEDAQASQAAAAATCGEFQRNVLPQLQQRAQVMTTIFALIDKIEEHVHRVRANVSEMERALQHAEQAQEAPKSFWSSWMSKPPQSAPPLPAVVSIESFYSSLKQ